MRILFSVLASLLVLGFGESCTPRQAEAVTQPPQVVIAPPPPTVDQLPFDEEVRRGRLDNGLEYFILENQRPDDRAELRLMVKAGSILEDDDQQGLAHFVEHMAFNGTENYKENELIEYLQSTGARFGPDLNAYTSFDETVYMLQVRTDSAEMLDKGLGILRDWAGGISFDDTEIDKERGVVLSEWRSGLGAQERMRNKTLPVIFANSRYAERLPIGDTMVLKQAPYDALKRYYRDWYRPDLMAVAVVGDVDAEDIEEQIEELFDDLQNPATARERTEFAGPAYDKTQVVVASDPEAPYTLVQVNNLLPNAQSRTLKDFRQNLTASLYNQMLGARFRENMESPDAPYSFAGAGRNSLVGNVDAYAAYALAKPGQSIEALIGVLNENKRVLAHGFLASELERAKANVLDAARNAAKEADKTPSDKLARGLVNSFLEDEPLVDAENKLQLTERYINDITLEDVNALAEEYMQDRPQAVVITGPTPAEGAALLPTEAEVNRALFRAKTMRVEPYVDQAGAEVNIPELRPAQIMETVQFDSAGITLVTLSNGVKVAYKATDIADNEVVFSAISTGGTNLFRNDQFPNAEFVNGIGSAMGLGPYTPSQLQKALAGKRVSVQAVVGENTENLGGSATPETLRDLFELIYLHFQGGAYNADLAEAFMQQQRSFIENLGANPQFKFAEAVNAELYGPNNPRHQMPSVAMLEAADTEEAYRLYRERFANATDWQFNFAGNFDPDTLLAYAKTYLGNLPTTAPADVKRDPQDELKKGNLSRRFKAGQAPKANILLARAGSIDTTERELLVFNTMVDALNEELRDKLREDLGGVYGVRVGGQTEREPKPEYFLSISFNAEPERVDELVAATTEVINRFKTDGPKEKTLAANRTTQYEQMKTSMGNSNKFWIGAMDRYYTEGRNPNRTHPERLRAMLDQVTVSDVREATRRYFDERAETKLEVVMEPE